MIVPFYNASKTIETTLSALIKQTLPSIEIICVNDGSTDDSPAKVKRMAKTAQTPIRLINQHNQGSYIARSNGIKYATGDYIGFCDADDLPESTMFESLYREAVNTNADLTICAYYREQNGKIISTEMNRTKCDVSKVNPSSGWIVSINTAVWNKLIRKELAKKHLRLNNPPKISEDALFLLSIYPVVKSIKFLPIPLYHYYTDNSQAMNTVSLTEAVNILEAWKTLRLYINNVHPDYVAIIDLAAFIHLGLSLPLIMIKSNSKDLSKYLKIARKALDTEFNTFKHSPFFNWSFIKKHHSQMILPFCAATIYRMGLLVPTLRMYAFVIKTIGKDLKW